MPKMGIHGIVLEDAIKKLQLEPDTQELGLGIEKNIIYNIYCINNTCRFPDCFQVKFSDFISWSIFLFNLLY